jgi:hypothetical protein
MAGSEVAREGVVGGIASKFGAVGAAGLVEQVADVARDGCGSDVEGGGDVAAALPGDVLRILSTSRSRGVRIVCSARI